jgi:hypothetical protein
MGQLFDRRHRIVRGRVDRHVRPEPLGEGQTLWTDVECQHTRAHGLGEEGRTQPDRTLAKDGNGVTAGG